MVPLALDSVQCPVLLRNMPLSPERSHRRLAVVVALTLLPWPAVWLGLYRLDSLFWTFVLYHGACLLPAVIWGAPLWKGALRRPTAREWLALSVAIAVVIPLSLWIYQKIGSTLMDSHAILSVVTHRGFQTRMLIPLVCYFVPVNAILEELFWRGVVLNTLRGTDEQTWTFGAVWTALTFAGWHYVVIRLLLRPGWAEAAILGILAAGVFLAWLYQRTRSVIVPILWHGLVFDLALMAIFAAVLRA